MQYLEIWSDLKPQFVFTDIFARGWWPSSWLKATISWQTIFTDIFARGRWPSIFRQTVFTVIFLQGGDGFNFNFFTDLFARGWWPSNLLHADTMLPCSTLLLLLSTGSFHIFFIAYLDTLPFSSNVFSTFFYGQFLDLYLEIQKMIQVFLPYFKSYDNECFHLVQS